MLISIFSIKDCKVLAFRPPFTARSAVEAQRSVANYLQSNLESEITRYAADFELYHIGTMNDENGDIDSSPEFICSIQSLIKKDITNA